MFRVLTTCFNAAPFIIKCLSSLKSQSISNWKCYIFDDCSNDQSQEKIKDFIQGDSRFKLIINQKKYYQVGNYYQASQLQEIQDEDVMVQLDGDDWLPDNQVLERLSKVFLDQKIWVSCGGFEILGPNNISRKGHSYLPDDFNKLRSRQWSGIVIRAWKSFLFRKIRLEHLKTPEGNFWEVAGDMAFFIPILEMAGRKRTKILQDINYIYNQTNPINDYKKNSERQQTYNKLIRKLPGYNCLSEKSVSPKIN